MKKIILFIFLLFFVTGIQAKNLNYYFRLLSDRDVVTLKDVSLALCLLVDGPYENKFKIQLDYLKKRTIINNGTLDNPKIRLSKGTIAVMFCRALKIKGGIMFHLFRNSQRYAIKELNYLKLMGGGNANEWISGSELIALLGRATDYREEHYR